MFKGIKYYTDLAKEGTFASVDVIMKDLNKDITIAGSKIIDYSLGFVASDEGLKRMEHYLFNGSRIQRNYCTLFFNRRGDWKIVKLAFERGLIDEKQAFSR